MIEAKLEQVVQSEQHNHCNCEKCECDKNQEIYKSYLIGKYNRLFGHIDRVSQYCRILAIKLIKNGEYDLAHQLLINSQGHDISKLDGIEWEYLCEYKGGSIKSPELIEAIHSHVTKNKHHPECWPNGIHGMDDVYIYEMVADWAARGDEFNKPILDFLENDGFKKYNFDRDSLVFKKIDKAYFMLFGENL